MTFRPVVSVVIPVLNAAGQLPALMDALERQTWPKNLTEIILVDNGSVDNTIDIASRYSVNLFRETVHRSPYAARNVGIEASRGSVIALLDANKVPDPLWIQSGVDTLAAQKADLVGGAIHFRLSNFSTAGELADAVLFNNNRDLVKRDGGSAGGNLFFRRDVWDKTGAFPSQFRSGMDIWWTRKAVKLGHRLVYAPEAVTLCVPRPAGKVIGKGYRVGKVHPINMQSQGLALPAIAFHSLKTLFPPRPGWVRIRLSELVTRPSGGMFARVWGVLWLTRIAMAFGRFRGLVALATSSGELTPDGNIEVSESRRIGFIYYTFFPVVGGASVHGYNLAMELNRLGYELWKLNGEPDPWTVKKPKGIRGLLAILRHCDVIYVRMDYFMNLRNLTVLLARLVGKKVIVELNSPSDELVLFGRGKRYIRFIDSIYRFILRRVNAVIVVSPEIEAYCKEVLGLENVTVIENGGEVFSSTPVADSLINSFREQYRTVIIWSGSGNDMQQLDWLREIAGELNPDQALVLSLYDTSDRDLGLPAADNIILLRNPNRQTISLLTQQADIGLAFYREYPWSRWGFYNSSLKIQEYLVNGLISISNIEGSAGQRRHPAFRQVSEISDVMEIIRSHTRAEKPERTTGRLWADVALDTRKVIQQVLNR